MSIQNKQALNCAASEEEIIEDSFFEKLLEGVGGSGRYQWKLLVLFLIPLALFYSVAMFNYILLMSTPKHHCYVPGRSETNFTMEEWNNLTIPWVQEQDGKLHLSQCTMYNHSHVWLEINMNDDIITQDKDSIIDCQHGWYYDNSSWTETPVVKFDLVCSNKNLVAVIFTLNMAGSAAGTLILSILSDRFGRKPIFYLALFINLIFGNALLFAPTFTIFAILKFISAMAFFCLYNLPYIIVIELCTQRLRTIVTFTTWFTFIVANAYISLSGWLLQEWKTFLMVTQFPLAIFILHWRFLPESPRWLLSRGKVEACEKVMLKIATTNGKIFTEEMGQHLRAAAEQERKKVPATKILTSFVLTKHLIFITMIFSLSIMSAVSLNLNVHNLKGSVFINYLFLRSFELPGDIFSTISSSYLGRRLNSMLCMILASIFVVVASFLVAESWPLTLMCGITKIFTRAGVYCSYMHIGELFPTPLRATSYGIAGIVSLTFTVLVPPIIALGGVNERLPYYIICGICIAATIIASFLPETFGNPLPQTIKEAKDLAVGQRYFSIQSKGNTYNANQRQIHKRKKAKANLSNVTDEKNNGKQLVVLIKKDCL